MQKVFNQSISNQIEIYCTNNKFVNQQINDDNFFDSINLIPHEIKKDRFISIVVCLLPKEKNWTNEYAIHTLNFIPIELKNVKY